MNNKRHKFDETKAKKAVKLLLEAFGEDLSRESIERTPERVAGFYKKAFDRDRKSVV